jgi:transposase
LTLVFDLDFGRWSGGARKGVRGKSSGETGAGAAADRGRSRLAKAWADSACHGAYRDWPERELGIEIAGQDPGQKGKGFQVLPRRWVVERTSAWVSRRRRCARDYERLPAHHAGMVQLAAIIQMTRRLARTTA